VAYSEPSQRLYRLRRLRARQVANAYKAGGVTVDSEVDYGVALRRFFDNRRLLRCYFDALILNDEVVTADDDPLIVVMASSRSFIPPATRLTVALRTGALLRIETPIVAVAMPPRYANSFLLVMVDIMPVVNAS